MPRSHPLPVSIALALLCISGTSVPGGLTSCLQVPWNGEALVRTGGQAWGGLGMSQCRTQLRLGFYLRQWLCPWQGSMYHNPPRSWLLGGSANPVLIDDQGTSLLLGPQAHTRQIATAWLFFLITLLSECSHWRFSIEAPRMAGFLDWVLHSRIWTVFSLPWEGLHKNLS